MLVRIDARRAGAVAGHPGRGPSRRGLHGAASQATYFLNIDLLASGVTENDMSFGLRAVKDAGVAAIPVRLL